MEFCLIQCLTLEARANIQQGASSLSSYEQSRVIMIHDFEFDSSK